MAKKFNWGAALMSAGNSMNQYAAQKRAELDRQAEQDRQDKMMRLGWEHDAQVAAENDARTLQRQKDFLDYSDPWAFGGSSANDPIGLGMPVMGGVGELGQNPDIPFPMRTSDYIQWDNNQLDNAYNQRVAEARAAAADAKANEPPQFGDSYLRDATVLPQEEKAYPGLGGATSQVFAEGVANGMPRNAETMAWAENEAHRRGMVSLDFGQFGLEPGMQYDPKADYFYDKSLDVYTPAEKKSLLGFDWAQRDQKAGFSPNQDYVGPEPKGRMPISAQYLFDQLAAAKSNGSIRVGDLYRLVEDYGYPKNLIDQVLAMPDNPGPMVTGQGGGEQKPETTYMGQFDAKRAARKTGGN